MVSHSCLKRSYDGSPGFEAPPQVRRRSDRWYRRERGGGDQELRDDTLPKPTISMYLPRSPHSPMSPFEVEWNEMS